MTYIHVTLATACEDACTYACAPLFDSADYYKRLARLEYQGQQGPSLHVQTSVPLRDAATVNPAQYRAALASYGRMALKSIDATFNTAVKASEARRILEQMQVIADQSYLSGADCKAARDAALATWKGQK